MLCLLSNLDLTVAFRLLLYSVVCTVELLSLFILELFVYYSVSRT